MRKNFLFFLIVLVFLSACFVLTLITVREEPEYIAVLHTSAAVSDISETAAENLININTASAEELQKLPGIGEVLAKRIIAYRTAVGEFDETSEIMNVAGIGEKTFENIKDLISVDN